MALFTVTNDSGFMLRQAPIRGIFSYSSSNDTLDRICLLDAATARSLAGYIAGNARTKDEAPVVSGNIDALFDSDASASVEASGSVDLAKVEGALADTSSRDAAFSSEGGAWNFILVRAKDGVSLSRLETSLSAEIKSGGFSVRLLDWRGTAGTQAQMIYALRIIFNAGIVILSFAAIIIIINSLTISTLERSAEIGTMRAIGASKAFVSRLFIAETTMVTVLGAVVGVALGGVVAFLIGRTGIRLTNSLLVSLFGGATLRPSMSLGDAFLYLAVALAMGAVAWIYPVRLVLRCTPLQAMNKAE
jgi:putative ABC transport system permease protein